jgi:hypothetical protein
LGKDFPFFCYGCDAHVGVDDTLALADLDAVLTPLGWALVSIEDTDTKVWVCAECQRCPYCDQLHGAVPSKMSGTIDDIDITQFTNNDTKKLLN